MIVFVYGNNRNYNNYYIACLVPWQLNFQTANFLETKPAYFIYN